MAKRKLFKNAIQCSLCEDIIESTYIHGFVECSCKACFVDGGLGIAKTLLKNGFSVVVSARKISEEIESLK